MVPKVRSPSKTSLQKTHLLSAYLVYFRGAHHARLHRSPRFCGMRDVDRVSAVIALGLLDGEAVVAVAAVEDGRGKGEVGSVADRTGRPEGEPHADHLRVDVVVQDYLTVVEPDILGLRTRLRKRDGDGGASESKQQKSVHDDGSSEAVRWSSMMQS